MKNIQFLFVLVCLGLHMTIHAQETDNKQFIPKHEIGLNFGSLLNAIFTNSTNELVISSTDYFLIYRKHKENKAFRFRLGGNLRARGVNGSGSNQTNFTGNLSILTATGWERKVPVSEKLSINYGLEVLGNFGLGGNSGNNSGNFIYLGSGLQALGGLQYHIADRLRIGMEAAIYWAVDFQQFNLNNSPAPRDRQYTLQTDVGYTPFTMFYCSFLF